MDCNHTLLAIDDNPANLQVLTAHLEDYGLEILTAPNGTLGFERARRSTPSLILLDVEMPGIDGYETCRRLKAHPETRHIPVVFLTVRSGDDDTVKAFDVGAADYCTKPLRRGELLARVRTQLALVTAESEREAAKARERVHVERMLSAQRERLTQLTDHWLEGRYATDRGIASAVPQRVAERLGLVRIHLEQVVQRATLLAQSDTQAADLADLAEKSLALLLPMLDTSATPGHRTPAGALPLEQLSPRELEVFELLTRGKSNKEIAVALDVAPSTVSTYRVRIFEKLGATDLPSLVRIAVQARSASGA